MTDCIFCKIASGEIPSTVVYEDDDVLVFMDIAPIIKGHALVVPRAHYEGICSIPDGLLGEMHRVAKRVALAQMNGLGADGVNIMQNNGRAAGQEVPHIHVHVIPRFKGDGHRWNWNAKPYGQMREMEDLAAKLRGNMGFGDE